MNEQVAQEAPSSIAALVHERLKRAIGPVAGPMAKQAALDRIGLADLQTATDLLAFADCLIDRGGIFEAVGRGLRQTALMRGAKR